MEENEKDAKIQKGRLSAATRKLYGDSPVEGKRDGSEKTSDMGERVEFSNSKHSVSDTWQKEEESVDMTNRKKTKTKTKKRSLMFWLFTAAGVFFVASVALATYMFWGANVVSPEKIDVEIESPAVVSSGESAEIKLDIRNRNTIALEDTSLIVEYPSGSRASSTGEELDRTVESVGRIPSGGSVERTLDAVFFGQEGDDKTVSIILEYRVKDSNALLEKRASVDISISSSPIIMNVENRGEVASGEEIEFDIEIASNTGSEIDDLILNVEYPFGFTFSESDPPPSDGDDTWRIGDLASRDTRNITLRGVITGENQEERTFNFSARLADAQNPERDGAELAREQKTVLLRDSHLALDVSVGGLKEGGVIGPEGDIDVVISWANNVPARIRDLRVEASLDGLLSEYAVVGSSDGGLYSSSNKTISWNQRSNASLAEMPPGERRSVSFSVSLDPDTLELIKSSGAPDLNIDIDITGNQQTIADIPERLTASVERSMIMASDLGLNTRLVYTAGPFDNTGPLPPRVGEITTYTVIWNLTNTFNRLEDVVVRSKLPAYVDWLGVSEHDGANISFDPVSGDIVWRLDSIEKGAGFNSEPVSAAFQIALTPSNSHISEIPIVVGEITARGLDIAADTEISTSRRALNTRLSTDPSHDHNDATVQP